MARPKNAYKKIEVSIGVHPYVLDQVKWISKDLGISQNEIFSQMINSGINKYYKSIGFTDVHKAILKDYTNNRIMYGLDDMPTVI